MKRWISLIAVAILVIAMSAPITVFATHGDDAHSSTMSVEADGKSVEEVQEAEGEIVNQSLEEEDQEATIETGGEELAEEAEDATDSMFSVMSDNWIYIAAGLGTVVLIIVAVVAINSSKGKHKNQAGSGNYKPKH